MKGIFQQIRESNVVKDTNVSKRDLIEFFENIEKSRIKERKRRDKEENKVSKYLRDKSKELNKEIPFELMVYTNPNINPSRMVGKWFLEKYKEWL